MVDLYSSLSEKESIYLSRLLDNKLQGYSPAILSICEAEVIGIVKAWHRISEIKERIESLKELCQYLAEG